MAKKAQVSLKGLTENSPEEWIKFTFGANPVLFKQLFAQRGIGISTIEEALLLVKMQAQVNVLDILKHSVTLSKEQIAENIEFI